MRDRTILILNGPGLSNRGDGLSLEQVKDTCSALCSELQLSLDFRQTEDQGEMLRWISEDGRDHDALLINPGGCGDGGGTIDLDKYDAAVTKAAARGKPLVEVRLHNIFQEGVGQSRPLLGPQGTLGLISGLGVHGYTLAISAVARRLKK